jgi:hypothetical protein
MSSNSFITNPKSGNEKKAKNIIIADIKIFVIITMISELNLANLPIKKINPPKMIINDIK